MALLVVHAYWLRSSHSRSHGLRQHACHSRQCRTGSLYTLLRICAQDLLLCLTMHLVMPAAGPTIAATLLDLSWACAGNVSVHATAVEVTATMSVAA
jgi:hypothetical protein